MLYSNILVAYDGSELGDKALNYGMDIAALDESTKLHVIHVVSFPHVFTVRDYINAEKITQMLMDDGQEIARKAEQKLSALNRNKVRCQVLDGQPAEKIVSYAKEENCDLIIMGSRGLNNLKELFLGSVSHHVVQRAEVPVFIIK